MSDTDPAAPIHPGKHLAEILDELGISHDRLATAIGVPTVSVSKIVKGEHSITGDTALRLGKALDTTPLFWLKLQNLYDLDVARLSTDTSGIDPLIPPPRWEGNIMV